MTSTAKAIFAQEGKLAFLAALANAAYRLRVDRVPGDGVNTTEVVADKVNIATTPSVAADFARADRYLDLLDRAAMPDLAPVASGNASFPADGLEGGIFTQGNAAALVGRAADALFVAFRGTNDVETVDDVLSGTPDRDHWTPAGKAAHDALFADLRAAIDAYLAANPGVKKIYVTGHSLGGAMAHAFMQEHAGDARYEAATFASLGFGSGRDTDDPRIINILNKDDIVQALDDRTNGDDNVMVNAFVDPVASHLMDLYIAEARFLHRSGVDFDQLKAAPDFDSFVFKAVWNGTAYVIGQGNDVLTGTPNADFVIGGAGRDTMRGGGGNDAYRVEQTTDRVVELANAGTDTVLTTVSFALSSNVEILRAAIPAAATALRLTGNGHANTIAGNAGANIIDGNGGRDTLRGGGGMDVFLFDTVPNATNMDTIADFWVPHDTIRLDNAVFKALGGTGTLAAEKFFKGAAAHDADDRIVYNCVSGALIYDTNGSAAGGAVQFAKLGIGLSISNMDFVVV